MFHAELWAEQKPVFFWAGEEADPPADTEEVVPPFCANTTIELDAPQPPEMPTRPMERFMVGSKVELITGAGERRPGGGNWKGPGNEVRRGCATRVMTTSFASFINAHFQFCPA